MCTDNIQNIDIGTLGTFMGPYFFACTWVGLIFGFQRHLPSDPSSVIDYPSEGINHIFHASVPDDTYRFLIYCLPYISKLSGIFLFLIPSLISVPSTTPECSNGGHRSSLRGFSRSDQLFQYPPASRPPFLLMGHRLQRLPGTAFWLRPGLRLRFRPVHWLRQPQ